MLVLKVFEIHTFRSGVWKIDSVFDDRDLAIMEADRMDRSKRFSAVRVIEETFDDETEKGNTRTIFRSTKAQHINTANQTRQKQGLRVAAAPPPPKFVKKKKTIGRQLVIAVFVLVAITVGGIGVLEVLNSLTGVR
jgi:hypothetical protein